MAVLCFFEECVRRYVGASQVLATASVYHETSRWDFHVVSVNGRRVTLCYGPVGARLAVNIMDDLYASGAEFIHACGCCGVLEDIERGALLLPSSAVRDEGTSYHYVPPSREIALNPSAIARVTAILRDMGVPHIACKTWTTDASRRETPGKIARRKAEGCVVVEMECAAQAACAQFNGKDFVEILYGGDTLHDLDNYDDRRWQFATDAREGLLEQSMEVAARLSSP